MAIWIFALLGSLLAVHLLLVIIVAEMTVHPPVMRRTIDTNTMATHVAMSMGAAPELVKIKSADGITLSAWWLQLPSTSQPRKAVLMCHGVADTAFGIMGAALLYLRHGYSVLAPDSRGHGGSGGFVTYGVREASDIAKWQAWMRERGVRECVAFGESLGASSLLQSLTAGASFSAIVAECPYSTFQRAAWDRGLLVWSHALPPAAAAFVSTLCVTELMFYLRLRYGLNLRLSRPVDAVSNSDARILLIHGTGDYETPIHHSQEIAAANPEQIQLWLVPGAGHTGSYAAQPLEFEQQIIRLIASTSDNAG